MHAIVSILKLEESHRRMEVPLCSDCVFKGQCPIASSLTSLSVPVRTQNPFEPVLSRVKSGGSSSQSPSSLSSSTTALAPPCQSLTIHTTTNNEPAWFDPSSLRVKIRQENCPFHHQKSFGFGLCVNEAYSMLYVLVTAAS